MESIPTNKVSVAILSRLGDYVLRLTGLNVESQVLHLIMKHAWSGSRATDAAPLNVSITLNVSTPLNVSNKSTLNVSIPLNVSNQR